MLFLLLTMGKHRGKLSVKGRVIIIEICREFGKKL